MVKKTSTNKKAASTKKNNIIKSIKDTLTKNKTTNTKTNYLKIASIILLILNLMLVIYIAFVKKDAIWLEQLKLGGKENYQLMEKLYKSENFKQQQTLSLNQFLSQMNGANTEDNTTKELDKETIDNIMENTFVDGKQDARYVILEYSDFTCGYCHRQHDEKNIQRVVEKYPNDVAHVFKNMPRGTTLGAEAAECAGKIGGGKMFYKFVDKLFAQQGLDETIIGNVAKEVGLNASNLLKCVNNGDTKETINKISQEFSSIFKLSGTPGSVILDRETGRYATIAGAYPFETFDAETQKLLNN